MSDNRSGDENLNWNLMKSKEQSFYLNLSENPPTAGFNELLKRYSRIPKEEISNHIEKVVRFVPC
jgi:hypothetical protein